MRIEKISPVSSVETVDVGAGKIEMTLVSGTERSRPVVVRATREAELIEALRSGANWKKTVG